MKIPTIFATALIMATMPGLGSTAAYAAKACKASVSGTGEAKANTLLARARAEQAWSKVAVNTYGSWHGIWLKAENRSMTCTITGKFPKTHSCVAIAMPCK